jgi:L-ribulose-5-phosphate 4-epimerase
VGDSFVELRKEVWRANLALPANGLVRMHSGNASGLHRGTGLILIKPSGYDYDRLRPENLCILRSDGARASTDEIPDHVQSDLQPSVDAIHHIALYRSDPHIGGVVHVHSNFATAWAAVGRAIPCALTAMADEFGGDIPCAPYADPVGGSLGRALVSARGKGPAVLAARHGLFTFEATPSAAVKAAVMAEDVAKTLFLAQLLGRIQVFDPPEIVKWWTRYHSSYGQPAETK